MMYPLFRPLLFALDPEAAHDTALAGLDAATRLGVAQWTLPRRVSDPVDAMGLRFPNRVGLAAGLDKNGRCIDGLGAMGFGFSRWAPSRPRRSRATRSRACSACPRPTR